MDMIWKYKIDLADEGVFPEIEEKYGVKIPEELKKLLRQANAATPSKYNFMLGTSEKVLGAILSFNRGEKDIDTVYTALDVIEDKNLVPFAIDPFGNYICYCLKDKTVVFWNHETSCAISTNKNLEEFLESLY